MRNEVTYEWVCEWVNKDGDIVDQDWSDDKHDVWPPRETDIHKKLSPRLAVVRIVGNDDDGEIDRGYAYEGDQKFCTGQRVPKHILKQFQEN